MTTERHGPEDLDWVRADDLLLDSLGRGEPGPGDDEVAAMLAAWRADMGDDLPGLRAAAPPSPDETEGPLDIGPVNLPIVPIPGARARRRLPRPRAIAVAATVTLIAALG